LSSAEPNCAVDRLSAALGEATLPKFNAPRRIAALRRNVIFNTLAFFTINRRKHMPWNALSEWRQKRALRQMLKDPRATRGFRSVGQLEKGIGADRPTTERLLLAIGARKSDTSEEWTLTATGA
jgi:hypothetical protein